MAQRSPPSLVVQLPVMHVQVDEVGKRVAHESSAAEKSLLGGE